MDRRINTYKKFYNGFGEILVQMNVEDTRLGVAEYVSSKHNLDTIELKWGQGAKCIGGEIKVKTLERALELKKRGYVVSPDPTLPEIQAAFKDGAIKEFERHSRLGFVTYDGFMAEIDRLRDLGFKRITLKTGAYSMVELAMALRYGAEAKLDLLTIDGAPGGTGMSPWPMMNEWGIPTFYLQSLAIEFANKLTKRGMRVPDLAMAGGFSTEDGVYKVLAMGTPYFKAVCMGRALMIPGMVGKNIQDWMARAICPRTSPSSAPSPRRSSWPTRSSRPSTATSSRTYPWGQLPSTPTARSSRPGCSSSWPAQGTSGYPPSRETISWPSPRRQPMSRAYPT